MSSWPPPHLLILPETLDWTLKTYQGIHSLPPSPCLLLLQRRTWHPGLVTCGAGWPASPLQSCWSLKILKQKDIQRSSLLQTKKKKMKILKDQRCIPVYLALPDKNFLSDLCLFKSAASNKPKQAELHNTACYKFQRSQHKISLQVFTVNHVCEWIYEFLPKSVSGRSAPLV